MNDERDRAAWAAKASLDPHKGIRANPYDMPEAPLSERPGYPFATPTLGLLHILNPVKPDDVKSDLQRSLPGKALSGFDEGF